MKSLIVYSSQTENTKKLADTIYENLEGEKDIFPIDKAPSSEGYDLIAIGFWLMAGKPDPKSSEYLEKIGKGARLFLFATHGASSSSDHVENAINHARGLTNEVEIAGVFTCQGEVNPKVLEKVKQKPEPPVWIGDADQAVGHPNEEDLSTLKQIIAKL
ncbi:MAG: flavodoxin family protein [Deltaproteobacteria bacterium]|nr:flavodoxin family protein [Deltaproteobacteria bacterium]